MNYCNNFPFTENSTMRLTPGLKLATDNIISANIQPHCGRVPYAYIGFIGRIDAVQNQASIKFMSPNMPGTVVCEAIFNLADLSSSSADTITAMVFDAVGICGSVVVSRGFVPVLHARYYPEPDAFILTPYAFRPRHTPNKIAGSLTYEGKPVSDIQFNSEGEEEEKDFYVDSDGRYTPNLKPYKGADIPKPPILWLSFANQSTQHCPAKLRDDGSWDLIFKSVEAGAHDNRKAQDLPDEQKSYIKISSHPESHEIVIGVYDDYVN